MTRAGRQARAAIAAAAAALCACACAGKGGATAGGGGGPAAANPCDGIRAKVERLYRAEAEAREPRRVAEAVADNTTMVMNDCARSPAKVARCVNGASSVPELEKKCLVPLDDEGTEGEELRR